MSLYDVVKARAYDLIQSCTGRSNSEARREGFRDAYDLLMSDSCHSRQHQFLMQLPEHFEIEHRQILLDGLAREYAFVESWPAYSDRETD